VRKLQGAHDQHHIHHNNNNVLVVRKFRVRIPR